MDFAIWSESLSVEIDLIDDQHKVLILLINDTSRMIMAKNNDKVVEILKELRNYTDIHFSEEEELFKRSDYPKTEKHVREHRFFINKLAEFEANLAENDPTVSINILEFLKNWLFYHIQIVDKGYSLYVKKALADE